MAQPQFASILNKAPSETERPKPLPTGSYIARVKGQPAYGESSQKKTPQVDFTMVLSEPWVNPDTEETDVDEEALDAALTKADGKKIKLSDRTMRLTYYLTEDALWRLKEFLKNCGIDADGAKDYAEAIAETPNCEVGVYVKHRLATDGSDVQYAEIGRTFRLGGN